jgi:hypothetical protein
LFVTDPSTTTEPPLVSKRDPGRLLLATAIEQRSSCEADVAACKAALARASEMVRQAEIRVEAAVAAIAVVEASASEAEAGLRRASSKVDDAGQERGEDV